MDLRRNYNQYYSKIRAILNYLDASRPSDTSLQRVQASLDKLANLYQFDRNLGADRYKLYVAQAMIDYYRDDHESARRFMEEAINIRGCWFSFAEEFLNHLTFTQSNLR
jgi:hypothetical protein